MTAENTKTNSRKKKHLLDYAGIWADIPEKEWKEFEEKIAEARKGLNSMFGTVKGLKKWTKADRM